MADTFALQLSALVDKYKDRADAAVHNIVKRVVVEIDKRSPVGDATYWKSPPPKGYVGGHFRANWQLGVDSRPAGEKPGVNYAAQHALNISLIPEKAAGKVYWLANNVPYARRIEDGWAIRAPQGVVGLTVIKFQEIVADAMRSAQ